MPCAELKNKVEDMFKTEVAAIKYQLLSLSKGGSTFSPGNDLGWCASFPAPVGSYVP